MEDKIINRMSVKLDEEHSVKYRKQTAQENERERKNASKRDKNNNNGKESSSK